jgi:transcriptional regulator with XRE-family HTH domain
MDEQKDRGLPWSDDPQHLIAWRKSLGLSQGELAQAAGISQGLVSAIERGTRAFSQSAKSKLWGAIHRLNFEKVKKEIGYTDADVARVNEEWSKVGALSLLRDLGGWSLNETPEQKLQRQLDAANKEIESLKQERERDTKIIDLLQDNATIKEALSLIERVQLLEKDNADLKRLVGLHSEKIHLESEVESRAEKKDK